LADKFSQYARNPEPAQTEQDKFAQYARTGNTPASPNSSTQSLLNRTDRNILAGLANLGQSVHNLPNNLVSLFSPEMGAKIPRTDIDFAQTFGQPEKEMSDILTQQIAEILPSFFIPGATFGKAGKALSSVPGGKYAVAGLGEAVPQTAYATMLGLQNSPEDVGQTAAMTAGLALPLGAASKAIEVGSPALKLAGRGVMGAAGGALGHELGDITGVTGGSEGGALLGAVLGGRGINVNKNAQKTVFSDLNPEDARKLVEASRRLGLDFITPGEAIENPFLAGEHARIGKTREGAKDLYAAGKRRVESEEKAIINLFDDIYSEGKLAPEKIKLYEESLATFVPDEIIGELYSGSKTLEKAVKQLGSKPEYQDLLTKKNYDINTIGYWNQVKRVLDGMEGKATRKGDNTEASVIRQTNNDLKSALDALDPNYSKARSIAEREFVRKDLSKIFNKSDLTLNRFNELLKNKEEFEKVRSKLDAFPDVQQKLDDMRLVAPRLQNFNPTNKATAALERTGMSTARNPIDAIRDFFQRNVYGKEDVEAVKLMTDPKWLERLEALGATGGKPKQAEELFNFAQAQGYPSINEAVVAFNAKKPGTIPELSMEQQNQALQFFAGNPMLAQWVKYLGRGAAQGAPKAMEQD
jgi:hypothetical protein